MVTEEAAKLRGAATSNLLKTALTQSDISRTLSKLQADIQANPPSHYETFKDTYMDVFVKTFEGTGSLLSTAKVDMQAIAGASAASLAPTGALSQISDAEGNLRSIAEELDKLADQINDILNAENSRDTYISKFNQAMTSMENIQTLVRKVLNALKAMVLQA